MPSPLGVYYLWEKLGPGNPAFRPLQCAQITLDLSYNSLILCSETLEPASDQETADAGLVGKENPHHCTSGGIFWDSPGEVIPRPRERRGGAVRWGSGLDPSLGLQVLPTVSMTPQKRVVGARGGPSFRWAVGAGRNL